jgi:hypothetical protein
VILALLLTELLRACGGVSGGGSQQSAQPTSSGAQPTSARAAGQFKELLAEFASAGDLSMNIDSSGKLFFQSANSGCVGNGALVPHLDGAADTYDVTLMMENCNGAYAYLNGQYDGLALFTASSYWDYHYLLRMWLSKPTGETPPAALTMLGEPP